MKNKHVMEEYGAFFYSNYYIDDELFYNEYIFANEILPGFKPGTISSNDMGKAKIYIKHYDIVIESIPFTTNKVISNVKTGDNVIVWIIDEYSSFYFSLSSNTYSDFVALAKLLNMEDQLKGSSIEELRSLFSDYENDVFIVNDGFSIRLEEDSCHLASPDTDLRLTDGSLSINDTSGSNLGFAINIFPDLEINTEETIWNTGTLELTASNPANIIKNRFTKSNGIMIKSMGGDIDITSMVGFVNIFNTLGINIMSTAPVNVVSGSLLNLTAPFIPSLTIGFGAPLLPSPGGLMATPFYINNVVNPARAPQGVFVEETMKGLQKIMKILSYNA